MGRGGWGLRRKRWRMGRIKNIYSVDMLSVDMSEAHVVCGRQGKGQR